MIDTSQSKVRTFDTYQRMLRRKLIYLVDKQCKFFNIALL